MSLITDYAKVARSVDSAEFDLFDFIIVGGGTAGCVLAARLSERSDFRVLVIEAGQSGKALFDSRAPAGFSRLYHSRHDYDFYTVPQQHAANKKRYWPRARLLGGCSSINAQMAHYGAPSDYDEFGAIVGDDSWAWKNFEPYFRKFENYSPDPKFPHVDASLRGAQGPVTIGYHAHTWQGSPLFVEASVNAGVPFNPDFTTSKGTLGTNKYVQSVLLFNSLTLASSVTYIDSSHQRVSAEAAYLTPDVLARPNLKVVTLARVTRIIFDSSSGTPRAVAVDFANEKQRERSFRAKARKEVIVCGGAIHTPQVLMLSGVGPAALLEKYNIPVVVESPGVGTNLLDHPRFSLRFKEKLGVSINYSQPYDLMSTLKLVKALAQYKIFGTGPLSSNIGEAASFFRTDDPKLFPPGKFNNDIEDSTSGPNAPDIELIIIPSAVESHDRPVETGLFGYGLVATLLRPTSTGTVEIISANPWDDPVIDPNYLATQHDLDVLIRAARAAYQIAHTPPLNNLTDVGCTDPLLDHQLDQLSDQELGERIRGRVETLYHPLGSCAMGKAENPAAVLDPQLRVRGALGLRVCDASIYPKIVSGHTTGPVLAAAEKLADILKAEYPSAI